ncbi:MAG: hypothetical protein R3E18_09695 [Sphingomonadaceae bacterium]|nr:hypothetical protein [Sphingomonadaceae bacterium]
MKLAKMAVATALAFAATPAFANPQVVAGATVYGPEGNEVGTIDAVSGEVASVNTGSHVAPLPMNAFGEGEQGPTITVTKAQLDEMMAAIEAEAAAKLDAALVEGAAVTSVDGQSVGTIASVEGDNVVLENEAGPVALKREHFVASENGLTARFTAEQIAQAIASSQAGA